MHIQPRFGRFILKPASTDEGKAMNEKLAQAIQTDPGAQSAEIQLIRNGLEVDIAEGGKDTYLISARARGEAASDEPYAVTTKEPLSLLMAGAARALFFVRNRQIAEARRLM